jgi:addiction module RelE/StbE family toxin
MIRSEPGEAEKLNQARRNAREGNLVSLAEFRRELAAEDE